MSWPKHIHIERRISMILHWENVIHSATHGMPGIKLRIDGLSTDPAWIAES